MRGRALGTRQVTGMLLGHMDTLWLGRLQPGRPGRAGIGMIQEVRSTAVPTLFRQGRLREGVGVCLSTTTQNQSRCIVPLLRTRSPGHQPQPRPAPPFLNGTVPPCSSYNPSHNCREIFFLQSNVGPSVGPQSHHVCPQVSPSSYAGHPENAVRDRGLVVGLVEHGAGGK